MSADCNWLANYVNYIYRNNLPCWNSWQFSKITWLRNLSLAILCCTSCHYNLGTTTFHTVLSCLYTSDYCILFLLKKHHSLMILRGFVPIHIKVSSCRFPPPSPNPSWPQFSWATAPFCSFTSYFWYDYQTGLTNFHCLFASLLGQQNTTIRITTTL